MKKIIFVSVLLLISIFCSCGCDSSKESSTKIILDGIVYELNVNKESYGITSTTSEITTDVIIPETVKNLPVNYIGKEAFKNCDLLNSIIINENIEVIDDRAFSGCVKLEEIDISPNSKLKYIGKEAFSHTRILSIDLPEGLRVIEDQAFYNCIALRNILIPNSIDLIGYNVFAQCDLEYTIYDNAKYLGNPTNPYILLVKTKNTEITSCNIKEGTRFICARAFIGCINLQMVNIPNTVSIIGTSAFNECSSLREIFIPSSVEQIESYAFVKCQNLKIYLETSKIPTTYSNDWLFLCEASVITSSKSNQ